MSSGKKGPKKPAMVSELAGKKSKQTTKRAASSVDDSASTAYRKMAARPENKNETKKESKRQERSAPQSTIETLCRYPAVRAARQTFEKARVVVEGATQVLRSVATEVVVAFAERRKARS